MYNTRYYKEKYEQLSKVSHKQMLQITVLQTHISKCEAIMAELKKISEGVYRQRPLYKKYRLCIASGTT